MEALRRPRGERNFAERCVFFQHIHYAQLVQVKPGMVRDLCQQQFRLPIQVVRLHQRADAGALVPLLQLGPPALQVVAQHSRLFHKQHRPLPQAQQGRVRTGDACEELPPGEHRHIAGSRGPLHQLRIVLVVLIIKTRARQPRMHRSQQRFRHRRFRQRQQHCLVQGLQGPLRIRVKAPQRLDLIAEKLDPHRPLRLRRVHVQDAAAPSVLSRHFHQVNRVVANAGQVRRQLVHIVLFAAAQRARQVSIVACLEQLLRRGFHRRNHNRGRVGGNLPQRRGAAFLHLGVRRQVLKRQHIGRQQLHDALRRKGAGQLTRGAHRQVKRLSRLVIRNQHNGRQLACTRQQRQVQGACRRGQPGDAPAPTP